MAFSFLSDDDEPGPSRARRGRATDTTQFTSSLDPSFGSSHAITSARPSDAYSGPNNAAGQSSITIGSDSISGAGGKDMIDLDDEELYEEGQETKVRELMRWWMDERMSPALLVWQGELVAEILDMVQSQNEIVSQLQGHANTTEEEHFAVMLVQTEVERIKFVLRSYLRCRLQKIETFTPHLLSTPTLQRNLSELEQNYVHRFGDLVGQHFQKSTLHNLPSHMHGLADENMNMASMITEPNKRTPVFFRVRDDCPPLMLPDGKSIPLPKGSLHLAQYELIEEMLLRSQVELV